MTKFNAASAARLQFETHALMTKMVRSRQMRIEGKNLAPAYVRCLESINKTKILCHKLRTARANQMTKVQNDAGNLDSIVTQVIEHATKNYEKGWDFLIECHTHVELAQLLSDHSIKSFAGAKKFFGRVVQLRIDMSQDHSLEVASGS